MKSLVTIFSKDQVILPEKQIDLVGKKVTYKLLSVIKMPWVVAFPLPFGSPDLFNYLFYISLLIFSVYGEYESENTDRAWGFGVFFKERFKTLKTAMFHWEDKSKFNITPSWQKAEVSDTKWSISLFLTSRLPPVLMPNILHSCYLLDFYFLYSTLLWDSSLGPFLLRKLAWLNSRQLALISLLQYFF